MFPPLIGMMVQAGMVYDLRTRNKEVLTDCNHKLYIRLQAEDGKSAAKRLSSIYKYADLILKL